MHELGFVEKVGFESGVKTVGVMDCDSDDNGRGEPARVGNA